MDHVFLEIFSFDEKRCFLLRGYGGLPPPLLVVIPLKKHSYYVCLPFSWYYCMQTKFKPSFNLIKTGNLLLKSFILGENY